MTDPKERANHDAGSLDRYPDQAAAADDVSGKEYEQMLDQGWSAPEREIDAERFNNANETLEDRLAEEVPDDVPGSAYGNPDGQQDPANEFDVTRAGRLEAASDAYAERGNDAEAIDEGFAGGASSAEEAAMHITDGN